MLGTATHRSRWLLWLLALAALCFLAAQFPEIRARLPWHRPPTGETR